MHVTISDGERPELKFRVQWRHNHQLKEEMSEESQKIFKKHGKIVHSTACFIILLEEGSKKFKTKVLGNRSDANILGLAVVHPNDSFDKAEGRRISLSKALKYVNKEYRGHFWKAFFMDMLKNMGVNPANAELPGEIPAVNINPENKDGIESLCRATNQIKLRKKLLQK